MLYSVFRWFFVVFMLQLLVIVVSWSTWCDIALLVPDTAILNFKMMCVTVYICKLLNLYTDILNSQDDMRNWMSIYTNEEWIKREDLGIFSKLHVIVGTIKLYHWHSSQLSYTTHKPSCVMKSVKLTTCAAVSRVTKMLLWREVKKYILLRKKAWTTSIYWKLYLVHTVTHITTTSSCNTNTTKNQQKTEYSVVFHKLYNMTGL
jgi:hypothetical protein